MLLIEAAFLTPFSISHVRGVLFVAGWVSAEGQQQTWLAWAARAGRGTVIHQEQVQCSRGSKGEVDKWLITSRNEMIHHFLKLSSLKDYLWRYIIVFYSRWSCYSIHAVKLFLQEKYILRVISSIWIQKKLITWVFHFKLIYASTPLHHNILEEYIVLWQF